MASSIQILRSTIAKERPFPGSLLEGQPAVNVNAVEPGLFFKATDGSLVKIGPAAITSDGLPPNNGGIGQQGNGVGELWFDASSNPGVLKIFNGSEWVPAGIGGLDPTVNSSLQVLGNITVQGDIIPTNDSLSNVGSPTRRFANIYTGDLHLSNQGRKNSVDGTWGSWTVEEGEDNLYLVNNRTGGRFKISLEPV